MMNYFNLFQDVVEPDNHVEPELVIPLVWNSNKNLEDVEQSSIERETSAMASTSGHKRNGSSSSMFAHKRTESGSGFIGQKRTETGHKRAESISSAFGHKRSESAHKRNDSYGGFGHKRCDLLPLLHFVYDN